MSIEQIAKPALVRAKSLSMHDIAEAKRVAQNYKLTPATLAYKLTGGAWIPAKHLMYISGRVAKGIAAGNARIIISAPPRHGKSELTSVHTPTWILECFPKYKTILAGYGADLSTGFSRRVRDVFTDAGNAHLLNTRIRRDAFRVEAFLNEQGGGMYAVGVGGPITGRGAHVLLIDDYIKEIKEALSPTYRDYIWNWFVTTAFTRLEPNGSCIIIATRWHSDDLIGRILEEYPEQWEYIEIPAIAQENDILHRMPGEALFPERYPIETLHSIKNTLGTMFFQALYQQQPVDESKKLTDGRWFKIIDTIPQADRASYIWARVWDLAATEGAGDYTVGTLIGYSKKLNHTVIANVIRKQISSAEIEAKVKSTALEDGPNVRVRIEQEPGSAGKHLVHHFATTVIPTSNVKGIPVNKDKLVRAQPFMAAAEAGNVSLLAGPWNDVFIREFDSFPGGINDDQVDTAASGFIELSGKKILSASWGRPLTPSEKKKTNNTVRTLPGKQAMFEMATRSRNRITFGR